MSFNEQEIILSFGVLSDVHLTGNEGLDIQNFNKALETLKKKTDGHLNAVCFAGDMLNSGKEKEAEQFIGAFSDWFGKDSSTAIFYSIGNHCHYGSPHAEVAKKCLYEGLKQSLGEKAFGYDLPDSEPLTGNRHAKINGYHFIAVEPDTYTAHVRKFSDETLAWLKNALDTARNENPDRYIFVFTHAMIYDTCYGSTLDGADSMWNTTELTGLLSLYPQVVTFGGHLHFPLNDERSIMQKTFTSVGTASVSYMAIERGAYEDMRSGTVMNDCRQFSQGLLAEIDADGNVRLRKLDFFNNAEIRSPWILSAPEQTRNFLQSYTENRVSEVSKPKLTAGNLFFRNKEDGTQELIVQFQAAKTNDIIHHYMVELYSGKEKIKTIKLLADFYLHPYPDQMKKIWERSLGTVEEDNLSVQITAVDSWDQTDVLTVRMSASQSKNT